MYNELISVRIQHVCLLGIVES